MYLLDQPPTVVISSCHRRNNLAVGLFPPNLIGSAQDGPSVNPGFLNSVTCHQSSGRKGQCATLPFLEKGLPPQQNFTRNLTTALSFIRLILAIAMPIPLILSLVPPHAVFNFRLPKRMISGFSTHPDATPRYIPGGIFTDMCTAGLLNKKSCFLITAKFVHGFETGQSS